MKKNQIKMNQYLKERVLAVANYILTTRNTIRKTAKEFGVSKSTIHKDVNERLRIINPEVHKQVQGVLSYHLTVRHIRGGEATKLKHKRKEVIKVG